MQKIFLDIEKPEKVLCEKADVEKQINKSPARAGWTTNLMDNDDIVQYKGNLN